MPIYEYRCDECSQVFEAIQRVADEPLDSCRHCGGPAKRIISSPAIHFVGSGWYVTDYARKGQKNGGGDGGEGSAAGKKGETASSGAKDGSGKAASDGGKKRDSARAAGGAGSDSSGGERRAGAAS